MYLEQIQVTNVRIVNSANFELSPTLNIIYGENGSGKTSLLESIYLLGVGRSFRSNQIKTIITQEKTKLTIFGKMSQPDSHTIGIERDNTGSFRVRIDNIEQRKLSLLAQYLPVLVITPESHKLISSGPLNRRQYLDCSVFHVKHLFSEISQRYSRILKQRNALLKSSQSYKELLIWDVEYAKLIKELNQARYDEFLALKPYLEEIQGLFLPQYKVQYIFDSGWDYRSPQSFLELLKANYHTDKRYGYTGIGAHKSDIKILVDTKPAHEVLSRGEQKMLVSSMLLAQAKRLTKGLNKNCIMLIDDLPSELDAENQERLISELIKLKKVQVVLTSIHDYNPVKNMFENQKLEIKKFHVKHGKVSSECLN